MRRIGFRPVAAILGLGLVTAACAPSDATPLTTEGSATSSATTDGTSIPVDGPLDQVGSAAGSDDPGASTAAPSERALYFVVAEEEARRVNVIAAVGGCTDLGPDCDVPVVQAIDLAERPHNLAASGGVVFATHPAAGSVSRIEVETGTAVTAAIGIEPHDIKYSPGADRLYVADEAGRRIFALDPDTLEVLVAVDLAGEPHDMAVAGESVWVTLVGRSVLARVTGTDVVILETGGLPHDLVVDREGRVWFSNWGSSLLSVFDPATDSRVPAPAGVAEPHHFAVAPDGVVWVSDNGGSSIVGFGDRQIVVEVGPVPHHLAFAGDTIVVAVSGSGQAIQVRAGRVVGRTQLTPGLHGVAVVEMDLLPNP